MGSSRKSRARSSLGYNLREAVRRLTLFPSEASTGAYFTPFRIFAL
jgi:hypothetical protein